MNKKIILTTTLLMTLILFSAFLVACDTKTNEKIEDNITQGEEMKNPIIVMETSKGIIELELDKNKAPISTENFLVYVKEGHYDGTIFHRVMPGFMIQGGGFTPDGEQKETHAPIKLESRNGLKNTKGTIAMARTSVPDSATSQFFINTVNNDFLNYAPGNDGYAVFGKVVSGMDVVVEIEKVKTRNNGSHQNWPAENVMIMKVYEKKN